ncbi:hypothetical protein BHM03_00045243, partial [Ensete ventricosum]
ISVYLSSRSQFSSAPPQNSLQGPATADNASRSRSYISKLVLGSVVIGAAITAAYKTGYLDIQVKDDKSSPNSSKLNAAKNSEGLEPSVEQAVLPNNEETSTLEPDIEIVEKSDEPQGQEFEIKGEEILERVPSEETAPLKENEPTEVDSKIPSEVSSSVADEQKADSKVSSEGTAALFTFVHHGWSIQQDSADTKEEPYKSLSDSYSLQDEGSQKISREEVKTDDVATFSTNKEEKYEKQLKDAKARALMYAEEAAILEKDEETDMQLKKVKELAKAELAAAIAMEKSSQLEKIAEADLNGTLALEDALSRGLPIRAEVDALLKSLEGIDKDSLIKLALSSLPEEILNNGTSTQMQLNQKASQIWC